MPSGVEAALLCPELSAGVAPSPSLAVKGVQVPALLSNSGAAEFRGSFSSFNCTALDEDPE